jgi:hypothetical protein
MIKVKAHEMALHKMLRQPKLSRTGGRGAKPARRQEDGGQRLPDVLCVEGEAA